MLPYTALLLLLLVVSKTVCSADPDPNQVISGVFLTSATDLNYENASLACYNLYGANLATLDQVTNAYKNGYEVCKWGWVEEHRIVMPRLQPFQDCGNYSVGILMRDCGTLKSNITFCIRNSGNSSLLYEVNYKAENLTSSFESASFTCALNGDKIPTKEQIENAKTRNITINSTAWFDWGIGFFNKEGTFEVSPCLAYGSQVSAFCYDPQRADLRVTENKDIWKRIVIGCILGSIFLILLFAAVFMRGNQCICCMEKSVPLKRDPSGRIQPQEPRWNTSSTYGKIRRLSQPKYMNTAQPRRDRRLSSFRPQFTIYTSHTFSNMGYERSGDE